MQKIKVVICLGILAACAPTPLPTESAPDPLPLGDLTLLRDPYSCEGRLCYDFEVACPEVISPEAGKLSASRPTGAVHGTVLLMSGGVGTSLFGVDNFQEIASEMEAAGFKTVSLAWAQGWSVGSKQGEEGLARLSCRPATVAAWVAENLVDADNPFCAVGGSGGAAQIGYMLTRYELEDELELALPIAGNWLGEIDEGCLGDDPLRAALHYGDSARRFVDLSYGFSQPEKGPCASRDEAWRERFKNDGISTRGDYFYPQTLVWFVVGGGDTVVGALRQGLTYYDQLLRAQSPRVRLDLVPNAPHAVIATPEGEALVRDIVIRQCRAVGTE